MVTKGLASPRRFLGGCINKLIWSSYSEFLSKENLMQYL